jgi:hypothetical protein
MKGHVGNNNREWKDTIEQTTLRHFKSGIGGICPLPIFSYNLIGDQNDSRDGYFRW